MNYCELVQNLCPNGVSCKPLHEISHYVKIRITDVLSINKENYVGVENLLQNKLGKSIATSIPDSAIIEYKENDILIGNIRPYLKKIWLANCNGGTNGDVLTIRINNPTQILPRFLYYVLSSDQFFLYDMQNSKGAKMPRGSKEAVMNYPIPLPPLEIQREIVRILDSFTSLTAELSAELSARQKQYSFYREHLLSFQNNIKIYPLRYVIRHSCSGSTPSKGKSEYYDNGSIPWIRTQDVRFNEIYSVDSYITELAVKETAAKWIPENCVIVAISGASAGRCAINKIRATTNQHCLNLEIDSQKALYRYVYHCVCQKYQDLLAKKQGARGDLNSTLILDTKIPVPPLDVQQRIVNVLDNFDAICSDLNIGLPAEISARQKQYEYYRDLLLSFKNIDNITDRQTDRA